MQDLTSGKEWKRILRFALPMLLGNVFQQMYNIVDSIIVGNVLGKEALAAVGASFPIIFLLISFIIGIASGTTILIAQYYGSRVIDQVKRAIDTLYIFLFFASLVVTALGLGINRSLFRLLSLPEELLPEALKYLNVYVLGILVFFGFNGTSAILRGLGDSKTPMYFLIISTLTNIGLDLLFIMVFGWGIAGAAWATVVSQGGAFVTAVLYLNRTHRIIHFSIPKMRFHRRIFWQGIRIGLPAGMQIIFFSLGMTFLMGIVNRFGTNVIAAYAAAARLDSIASLPAMNFGMALSVFVGQNLGANKPERIKRGLVSTIMMSGTISVTVTLVMMLFGENLMSIFTNDHEVIRIGHEYLLIISAFYLVFSLMFSLNGVLRGAGDTLIPMFITLLSLWVIRIPASIFLSNRIGETGIWWSAPLAWIIGLAASYIYYLSVKWKANVVVKH